VSDAAPLLFLLLALGVFWFLVMRPARTQQKKVQQLQRELAVGQEVVMSNGIFGTVRGLTEGRAEIEVAPGTVLTVARQVVVRRVEDLPETPAARETDSAEAIEPDRDGPASPDSRA
jgi:preprotein translocase subunit YajC